MNAKISVIIPARNEAPCIASVLQEAYKYSTYWHDCTLQEIIVVDNGSTDETAAIAKSCGATVISEPIMGYGQACWTAAQASQGDVLLFVDGDGAADFAQSSDILKRIVQGADLVIGVRENCESGSMTLPQRLGNQFACTLIRWLWGISIKDLGPYRAIRKQAFDVLNMRDRSYGWTVEMQIRAASLGMQINQCSVNWRVRIAGHSKISGTVGGVIGAGIGIFGMIMRLWWRERRRPIQIQPSTDIVSKNPIL